MVQPHPIDQHSYGLDTLDPRQLHDYVSEATQRLLSTAISLTDEQWLQPSYLTGWTRAHVASHVTYHAWMTTRAINNALTGTDTPPTGILALDPVTAVERGADRSAMQLYIDLDTSAGALTRAVMTALATNEIAEIVLDSDQRDPLRGPLWQILLIRLHELTIHHLDLDTTFDCADIATETSQILLKWLCTQFAPTAGAPVLDVRADSGFTATVDATAVLGTCDASGEHTSVISGMDRYLYAWLAGRITPTVSDHVIANAVTTTPMPF